MQSKGDLKNTGLKATLPRITILELFQKSGQRHMSAEDVYRLVLQERADIGLATIYRVLMQFEQAGLLTRSQFESGKAVYELNEGQHLPGEKLHSLLYPCALRLRLASSQLSLAL
jgi:Fur family ferric uptake transcriptional regulator